MEQEKPLRAWFGDPDLKARVVAKMKQHRVKDEFIQGVYQSRIIDGSNTWKGCAIGCTLPHILKDMMGERDNWHKRVQDEYGINHVVAEMIDSVFEAQYGLEKAGDFAVAVIEAIPVGADLTEVARIIYDDAFISFLDNSETIADHFIELLAAAPVPETD